MDLRRRDCFQRIISRLLAGRWLVGASLLGIPFLVSVTSVGQPLNDEHALELSLANAYVYIASRTTWPSPPENSSSFFFCIEPSHHLFEIFSKLLPGKQLHGRTVEIRTFDPDDSRTQASCDVIALSSNDNANKLIVSHTNGKPILTISDEVDITRYDGLVFLSHDKRLEPPKINFGKLQTLTLKIDAAVLNLSEQRWGRGDR